MQEEKQTLYELLAGIVIFLLVLLLGNVLVTERLTWNLGLLLGGVIAWCMTIHMYHSLQLATLYDEETATKKVKKSSFLRMILMVAGLIAAVVFPNVFSMPALVLGVLTLKFSAYLQPLTHKVFNKILNKGTNSFT